MITSVSQRRYQYGLTLVELMISMLLGLLILGGVLGVFISSTTTFTTTRAIDHIQENARFAIEYFSRDIREAGLVPCNSGLTPINLLKISSDNNETTVANITWADFTKLEAIGSATIIPGIDFNEGTNTQGTRIDNSIAIRIGSTSSNVYTITNHNPNTTNITINTANHRLSDNDIVLVCDVQQAAIFQLSNSVSGAVISYDSTGNCKSTFTDNDCSSSSAYTLDSNAMITSYQPKYWYLGCNGRAACTVPEGRSLFFTRQKGGNLESVELIDSVELLNFEYLETGETDFSASFSDVNDVDAVKMTLTLTRSNAGILNGETSDLSITYSFTAAVRN